MTSKRTPHPLSARPRARRFPAPKPILASLLASSFLAFPLSAASPVDSDSTLSVLKKLSFEELMSLEVTSVSRRPEKLYQTASAIQLISGDEIRRSGATSIPQALRLATNLQVAQVNTSQWAISARGFNNVLANKLLVMIDGRTVYTPLYAGVFWDAQDTLLEDLDRIEVISGPGGTLWGANAVNGVINIITKNARDTQGLFVEGAAGDELRHFAGLRYGGRLAPNLHYRVYGKTTSTDNSLLLNGTDARDAWRSAQGGLRLDWDRGDDDLFTLQADYYQAKPNPDGNVPVSARGQNVLARWTRSLSPDSDFKLQLYYDRTWRDFNNGFKEGLRTFDLDWQHRFQAASRHEIVWGAGVRSMQHAVENLPLFAFLPARENLHLYSGFLQDEITLVDETLRFTLGAKFEHTHYTGLETQPGARLAWTPSTRHTLWSAVSRAVRTPARTDRDFYLYLTPTLPFIGGGPTFESETVVAHELGWRFQPSSSHTISIASFYNEYDNLRSVEPGTGLFNLPVTFANGVRGNSRGVELSSIHQITPSWRLRAGYTWLRKDLSLKPGSQDTNRATAESDDPDHQFQLQSSFTLPGRVELDLTGRYVDELTMRPVPAYTQLDVRLAWRPTPSLELSVVGQNLLDPSHPEFVPSSPSPREIERSLYGKVAWRY